MSFSDKTPDEIEYVGFKFHKRLAEGETISTAVFSIAVVEGTDASANAMLQGSPVIDGATVKQKLGAGVVGVHYRIGVRITTSTGQALVESGDLVVKDIG